MNFLRKHNFGIILTLLLVGLLSYAIFTGYAFYPEYLEAREHSITLKSVLAGTILAGNIYFLLTLPIYHWLTAKLNTNKGEYKKTDSLIMLCKLSVFALWVYISHNIYNSDDYNDYVDRMIIVGIFGVSYILFDLLYFGIILFTLSTRSFVDSFTTTAKNPKNKNTPEHIIITEHTDNNVKND